MTTEISSPIIDAQLRASLLEQTISCLHGNYVFPEVAEQVSTALRDRLTRGDYDTLAEGRALAERLTADLQELSRDRHLRMIYFAEPQPSVGDQEVVPAWAERYRLESELANFGFQRVERLAGNIGYLDLRSFRPAGIAGDTAVAAMRLLASTYALIVDLRQNGGGDPAMVALLCSYLFDDQPVHLNSLYSRRDDSTQQYWTHAYLPGPRYAGKPVYVLISARTFSGAEEFAYNLQNLKRATLIGETTGGGAHPVDQFRLHEHFAVRISIARAINPVSKTNWEQIGVVPDIAVPADAALDRAHALALQDVLTLLGEGPRGPFALLAEEARTALAALEGRDHGSC